MYVIKKHKKSYNLQKRYRSGVGTLIYLVKHSQPELSYTSRELSKFMDYENMIRYKALPLAIKYIIDQKDYCYQMKPDGNINGPLVICGYSDRKYAGDNDTRKSMIGYIVLINRAFIAWCLRSQKTVTLSITEAEYSAIMEVCCKILYFSANLLFMGVFVEYLITMHVDNVGTISLSENTQVSQRTNKTYVRHQFIRDHVEDVTVKIQFVRSEENTADPFTKELSNGTFELLTSRYVHCD